ISSIGHRLVDARGQLVAGTAEIREAGSFRQPGEQWESARTMAIPLPDGGMLTIVAESQSIEDMS
ncbi:hypothetical protein, partial [Sphingomonas sp. 66-10]|uniref:hypothetical protein n=1 Tax=Sphingomonas sp. 66-10 TaxID=1895848 RepID=UPI0025806558